jgi:arylsulfatase A-like enzyme
MSDNTPPKKAGLGRPNVILVTFDSLSAKNMSLYGYPRNTTPFLDSFADESCVFEQMLANSNSTLPSLSSIFAGRYPLKHGYDRFAYLLAGRSRAGDLDHVLKSEGYRTAAVIGTRPGYLWIDSLRKAGCGRRRAMAADRPAWRSISGVTTSLDATFRKTLEVLDSAREPFFLWLHLYPPHEPYLASRSFRGTFVKDKVFDALRSQRPYINRFYPEASQPAIDMLRGRYDEHLLEVDNKFGGFLETLRGRGLLDTSMVVVTSDHGEMFEKGYQGHGGPLLYNPLVHVPLMVRLPDGQPGRRVKTSAEHVDIAPTILDLLGVEIPRYMQGESLAGAIRDGNGNGGRAGDGYGAGGRGAKPKFSVSTECPTAGGYSRGRSISAVCNGRKLILNLPSGACELYDRVGDPEESTNIATGEPDTARGLKEMILERFADSDAALRPLLPEAS